MGARRGKKHRRAVIETGAIRKVVPLSPQQRRWMRVVACLAFAMGGVMLLKAAEALLAGTAWDDLSTSSREAQPVEYWLFVMTYLVLGGGISWLGVGFWRTR